MRRYPRGMGVGGGDTLRPVWLGLTLLLAALAAALGLADAFAPDWLAQDDARQHVFWMARLAEPSAFPNDPIADYFQSVAPPGYVWTYRLGTLVGLDPWTGNRLIPALLTPLIGWLAFRLATRLGATPFGAFLAGWLLVVNLWLMDDLPSGTPRAFAVPILLWVFDAWLRRRSAALALGVAAAGLFYPQIVLVSLGVVGVGLIRPDHGAPFLSRHIEDWRPAVVAGAVGLLVLMPYVLAPSPFGPVIAAEAARLAPEFGPGGRSAFFDPDPVRFLTCGGRSGLMPKEWCFAAERFAAAPWYGVMTAGFLVVLVLPWLLDRLARRRAGLRGLPAATALMPQTVIASLTLFGLAHLLLFALHLPSRYTHYSLRILFAMAVGLLAGWFLRRLALGLPGVARALALAVLLAAGWATVAARDVADNGYVRAAPDDPIRDIFDAIARLPRDATVATLSTAGSQIPSVTGRSVLVAHEFMIPYHRGHFEPLQARAVAFVSALSADDPIALRKSLSGLGVTHVLLDSRTWSDTGDMRWVHDLPGLEAFSPDQLGDGIRALARHCTAVRSGPYRLIAAGCDLPPGG